MNIERLDKKTATSNESGWKPISEEEAIMRLRNYYGATSEVIRNMLEDGCMLTTCFVDYRRAK
jgi:hypothetical protein